MSTLEVENERAAAVKSDLETAGMPATRAQAGAGARLGSYGRFYTAVALLLFAVTFGAGVLRWVQLSDQVGGPVGLFTQTDFPAGTIATRLINSGRVGELYNLQSQLGEQKSLAAEGWLALTPAEAGTLHYPYPYAPFIALFWAMFAGVSPLTQMALYGILNIAGMAAGLWLLLVQLRL